MEELLRLLDEGTNIELIQEMACSILIDENGQPIWDAIEVLQSNGYPVFPVEQDRFGWLLGGIETSKGVIIYG